MGSSPTELAEALQLNMAVNRLTKHLNVNASRLLEEHRVKYENKNQAHRTAYPADLHGDRKH